MCGMLEDLTLWGGGQHCMCELSSGKPEPQEGVLRSSPQRADYEIQTGSCRQTAGEKKCSLVGCGSIWGGDWGGGEINNPHCYRMDLSFCTQVCEFGFGDPVPTGFLSP